MQVRGRPFNLPGPALLTLSREYSAHPQAAAPHAPMRHRNHCALLHRRTEHRGDALQRALLGVWSGVKRAHWPMTHGRVRSSSLRVGGILFARGHQRRARAGWTGGAGLG